MWLAARGMMGRQVVCMSLLVFFCLPVHGADTLGGKIRVITYNVQFLPEPISSKNERPLPEYRATRIAKEVSRFDIVGLQETFHDKYRGQIVREVKQHWQGELQAVESPTPDGFLRAAAVCY
jgi:hypothetical protein